MQPKSDIYKDLSIDPLSTCLWNEQNAARLAKRNYNEMRLLFMVLLACRQQSRAASEHVVGPCQPYLYMYKNLGNPFQWTPNVNQFKICRTEQLALGKLE